MNQRSEPSSRSSELEQFYRVSPDLLRATFRPLNKLVIALFRMGLGPYIDNPYSGSVMVLTTVGRKSGILRHTPLTYALGEGEVYCGVGFGHKSDWYRNLLANPSVQVWIKGQGWIGRAEIVTDPAQVLSISRQILHGIGFADRAFTRTSLSELSDETLLKSATEYPVIRIRLDGQLPKGEGPGDLAWLWPVLGMSFLAGWAIGKARGKKSEHRQ
ncbi:MAG: nitroreductase family deazaflavin-dependent oxidoreductase [Chloroflexi bacterium]|nr:nitroreductase family deazaflavin-dependent oxidoreductase [Chloroflexota bacterium]